MCAARIVDAGTEAPNDISQHATQRYGGRLFEIGVDVDAEYAREDTENVRAWTFRVVDARPTETAASRDGKRFTAQKSYCYSKLYVIKDLIEDAVSVWGYAAVVRIYAEVALMSMPHSM